MVHYSKIISRSIAPAAALLIVAACSGGDKITPETPVEVAPPASVYLSGADETSLTFSWDRVEGAEYYTARLEDGNGNFEKQDRTEANTYTFRGLETGKEYRFKVRVKTADGDSGYSEPVTAVPGTSEPGEDPGTGEPDVPLEGYGEFLIPEEEEDGVARAFPGAEGGGMYTTGGRGGRVIHVTNLNDSGTGSLRAAVEASGARTVVFDVAGIIDLESQLRIRNGDLTIAGQTAPGDGICIRNYSTVVDADNVIIRFVRFRLGNKVMSGDGEDCIWGRRHSGIIIDHCSMSWSIDECASFYGNENFTMQWCIMTESLRNSRHPKGNHGYGGIWGGSDASFHHNMLANHDSRNPRFDHPEIYENPSSPARRGHVDYRNNSVYNWGSNNTYGGEGGWFNIVNNYYKKGEASRDRRYIYDVNGIYTSSDTDYGYPELYVSGNVYADYPSITADNLTGLYWHDDGSYTVPADASVLSSPLGIVGPSGQTVYTSTHPAEAAFEAVCEFGGASLSRDAVDERATGDAISGTATYPSGGNGSTGGLIDTQEAVGGWPEYTATEEELAAVTDTDGDGMPDWFEEEFGLDPSSSADGTGKDLDTYGRYTNLEMYLHYLVKDIIAAQNAGAVYMSL